MKNAARKAGLSFNGSQKIELFKTIVVRASNPVCTGIREVYYLQIITHEISNHSYFHPVLNK
jgi:hypothetical protein